MKLSPGRSPGRLSALLAERDAARAERDAANIALAMQIQKDLELEKRLEALESMQQPERMAASQMRLSLRVCHMLTATRPSSHQLHYSEPTVMRESTSSTTIPCSR